MGEVIRNWWQAVVAWAASPAVSWVDLIISGVIAAAAIVIAVLFSIVVFPRLLRLSIMSGANFDVKTVASVRLPLAAFIILSGLYLALLALSPPPTVQIAVNKISAVVAVSIGAVLIHGMLSAGLLWLQAYLHRSDADPHHPSNWLFPMVRRAVLAFVVSAAVMVSLDILGINITPLVAGLGIAGLAVALALQPTLGNLFAGTYVVSEGVVNVGDYIEMSDGTAGYVVDVSWRSTRIRTITDNLVVVPNSLFAETVITNFNKPGEPLNIIVPCGVSYQSDLVRVEEISLEVMNSIQQGHPDAVPEFEPRFRYQEFGDSNVNFVMVVRAQNRIAGFVVRNELIKRIHSRFAAEGITINYPVRKLEFPEGAALQGNVQLPLGAETESK